MGERTRKLERLRDKEPVTLGVLIHDCVREAVEQLGNSHLIGLPCAPLGG